MMDYLNIGSTPGDEPCAQVGSDDYSRDARKECARYIDCIRKKLGPEPSGAYLKVKGFDHDFGTYYEVVCYYDTEDEESQDYAFLCESNSPSTWDDIEPLSNEARQSDLDGLHEQPDPVRDGWVGRDGQP
jgi:hypothetical protein